MRTPGLCLAILASAQLTLATSPAFAQPPTDPAAPPPPAPSSAAAPAPAAPAPAEPVATATSSSDGNVPVHINSPKPVTLQRRSAPGAAWETACTSPCDQKLPVGDEYQITGEGLAPSKTFRLNASKGTVTLDVSPGNPTKKKTGVGLMIAGGVTIVAGAIVMAVGSKPSHTFQADGSTNNSNYTILFVGGLLVISGIGAGIYGGALYFDNGTSAVEGDTSKAGPVRGALDHVTKTGQIPAPTTPTFILPVYSGTF